MPLLSPDTDADALHARIHAGDLLVACLCAEWCGTCRSYRTTFADLATRYPQHCFVWVDVEDHADALGDLDVENFPTLLVQRGRENDRVLFFGPVLPHAGVVEGLLSRDLASAQAVPVAPNLRGWLLHTA
ncbi:MULTISPECIES: thioredoxin family protein [Ralstonia solanacearum species complex]|uniref:Thioredoxin n=2 Tax=Ralstonia solanacearum species complex TaxID=3116862 RepID=A0AAD0SBE9_RALSL|nr:MULTISPECIES: thioredoxin family protein [Ralstonia solanacearum species complex]AXV78350.1 thioredoxin [Ralstonia solanacearum]AXV82960.1 thioredoxin [Ralstonia solanacearum]AXV92374.1 thioredoxin [Ralstonia solanacearum]AXW20431.1 thioredoxin [Ralstonia solanacearum]AXW54076.1 thioredoxin [Ralstonia solanacearum]